MEHLDNSSWFEGFIDNRHIWTCDNDVSYQIMDPDEEAKDFHEEWTENFPDPHAFKYPINLIVGGITIKQISFISIDGGRYFVPLPEIEIGDNRERSFYWNRSSLEYKVGQIISRFYQEDKENLDTFAKETGIKIK